MQPIPSLPQSLLSAMEFFWDWGIWGWGSGFF
ncbi:hypothetical protein Hypma_003749 [Hypsizygus marmoreus]|uniref:Uncharacterized protein n=1 Tax=Hypsizygus marmoreus TaxID=39966 RepID=A0A369J8K0_HYPMA|nr:hypothetical protein Hypma_003749 [Hypsizygus marmoreus]